MLIDPQTKEFLIQKFTKEIKENVEIKVFTRDIIINDENPEHAQFAKELINELSLINNKIRPEYLSLGEDIAKKLGLSFSPTIVLGGIESFSIQYWGAPAGQIAGSLIETISLISQRKSGLNQSMKEKLENIDKNLLIETYFSTNSPVASQAILLSNRIAVERPDRIKSRSIDAQEAMKRAIISDIPGVPFVLINGKKESLMSGMISQEKLLYQLISYGSSNKDTILAEIQEEEKKKTMLLDNPDFPLTLTTSNFDEAVKKYPVIIVDCWAEWCAPCHMVHPIIENLSKKYKGKIAFAKLNIDENREIAERFSIMSIPNLLVFKSGQKLDSIIGAMPQEVLEEKIKIYLT